MRKWKSNDIKSFVVSPDVIVVTRILSQTSRPAVTVVAGIPAVAEFTADAGVPVFSFVPTIVYFILAVAGCRVQKKINNKQVSSRFSRIFRYFEIYYIYILMLMN